MNIESQVVHAGDRKRKKGAAIPSTTPIHLGTTFFYDSAASLDYFLGQPEEGFSYARYSNPTNEALEELTTALENGHGSLATSSGMAAIQIAIQAALIDQRHTVVASHAIYGATVGLLDQVLSPFDVDVRYTDICDLDGFARCVEQSKPGCVFLESISNPLLRVGDLARIVDISKQAGAAVIVDNTFATPIMLKPLELGASFVVHSATKYLAGHGDVLGGIVVADKQHNEMLRKIARIAGPQLGPFESYLTMRGIKTLAVRFERQCHNARVLAQWLTGHPAVERVYYLDDPKHPDAQNIKGLFNDGLFGAILSFEIKGASKSDVLEFMDQLQMIVPGTSLGDVHTLLLYPWIASHRNVSPRMRERMGIRENLVRIAAGIENVEDIKSDLERALQTVRTVNAEGVVSTAS